LVEHATENRSVGGSIPPLGTIPPPQRSISSKRPTGSAAPHPQLLLIAHSSAH
jgi:hypothetical protein